MRTYSKWVPFFGESAQNQELSAWEIFGWVPEKQKSNKRPFYESDLPFFVSLLRFSDYTNQLPPPLRTWKSAQKILRTSAILGHVSVNFSSSEQNSKVLKGPNERLASKQFRARNDSIEKKEKSRSTSEREKKINRCFKENRFDPQVHAEYFNKSVSPRPIRWANLRCRSQYTFRIQ